MATCGTALALALTAYLKCLCVGFQHVRVSVFTDCLQNIFNKVAENAARWFEYLTKSCDAKNSRKLKNSVHVPQCCRNSLNETPKLVPCVDAFQITCDLEMAPQVDVTRVKIRFVLSAGVGSERPNIVLCRGNVGRRSSMIKLSVALIRHIQKFPT
jgi:hypothetical protein